ncbi:MAG: RNase III inhibitor, partial [Eubacteriales bacterium]|nr:RNase III inhibitor [Eubacteriales bacterium]
PDAKAPKPAARPSEPSAPAPFHVQGRSLQDVVAQAGETFQESLLRMIDERGLTDIQVYKRANIDRRLFSKIRSNPKYNPKRQTAISLGLALELNMDEMRDLLGRAGFALSNANIFDLIISYCVQNRIYDIILINALLFDYDQPLLGA